VSRLLPGSRPARSLVLAHNGVVAVPVAGLLTRGAFLRDWRLMAIDGFELDVPDTPANAAAFGYPAGGRERPAFPKVRVVTIGECGSHATTSSSPTAS
jgi:hypothetical protein